MPPGASVPNGSCARIGAASRGGAPVGRKYQIISGDGHIETPPDFVKYVPDKWKDRAPRLITLPDGGGDAWMMEGMPLTYASQNLKGRGTVKFAGQSYFDARRLARRGRRRRPPAAARAGRGRARRRGALRAGVREPLPRQDPGTRRLPVDGAGLQHVADRGVLGTGTRPAHRERAHADEWHRPRGQPSSSARTQLGFQTVQLLNFPNGGGGPKPEDDRFWEKALELEMPLSPHFGFGGVMNIGGAAPRHRRSGRRKRG